MDYKTTTAQYFRQLQDQYFSCIEKLDPSAETICDPWERSDQENSHGGGGIAKILRNGKIFEQAGVNFSQVYGTLPSEMTHKLLGENRTAAFYATGVSLVFHPYSPLVPTVHANFRYLEVENKAWFGGGTDLTPYVLFEEDAIHFHTVLKNTCDQFNPDHYPNFKKQCDQYFYIEHRKEARGIGGIFFDYIGKDCSQDLAATFELVKALGAAFLNAYCPIVEKRKDMPWQDQHKQFQLLRRGRYVEFNLIYDRGTLFGLRTNGRVESIFMSLPPQVKWTYNYQVNQGGFEQELLHVLKSPKNWV